MAGRHLSRDTGARRALFRNLISELIRHERIQTTEAKARAIRGDAEKMITLAKRGDLHARRLVARTISDPELVKKLFDEVAPRYADRPGGYTRIIKLEPRQGDAAPQVLLELVK
ncbi:MAG: 50S ribosomal protein L17 [Chloroflexi bacterium]|nr:50S ribosomal protein L17 [Chloroflexota bacterium]